MEINLNNEMNLEKGNKRDDFLNSTLWKTINQGIDIGLRCALPDLIENKIIEIKDNLIKYGLKDRNKKINIFYDRFW